MRVAMSLILLFFVIATIILVITMPNLYLSARRSEGRARAAVADEVAEELSHLNLDNGVAAGSAFDQVRRRHHLLSIEFYTGPSSLQPLPPKVWREVRDTGPFRIEIRGEEEPLLGEARRMARAATMSAVVALISAFLLIALQVRELVSSPARGARGLPDAQETSETSYLFRTFESSIQTLKGRESALRRMHEEEVERATELANVTSTLLRSITSGFISIDEHGRLVDMNLAAREILGITPDLNVNGLKIQEGLGASRFAQMIETAFRDKTPLQRVEIEESARDQIIGLATVPLLDPYARFFGMLALFTDLTAMRRLENQVRDMQALADLGEMSAGIAHEFRNSLSTILGYLNLARKSALEPEIEGHIRNADIEAKLLNEAVGSLLTFARPMRLQVAEAQVDEILTGIAERLQPLTRDVSITVQGEPFTIEGDVSLLTRAFENLLRNAVDAIEMRGGTGRVWVTTSASPRSVSIEDDGIGVSEADVPKLFLPFRSNKPNGFGLGLALTRKIVLLHGGSIAMAPRPEGGTVVTVDLEPIV